MEPIQDLESRLQSISENARTILLESHMGQLYRLLYTEAPQYKELAKNRELIRDVIYAREVNRVQALHYIADQLMQAAYFQNLDGIKHGGQAWEVNDKAEQAAIFSSDFVFTYQQLERLKGFEEKFLKKDKEFEDSAYNTAKDYKKVIHEIVPHKNAILPSITDPEEKARIEKKNNLLDESKYFRKGINVVIDSKQYNNPKQKKENEVWFNTYHSPQLLKKFNLSFVQLREKTIESTVRHLASQATKALMITEAYKPLMQYNILCEADYARLMSRQNNEELREEYSKSLGKEIGRSELNYIRKTVSAARDTLSEIPTEDKESKNKKGLDKWYTPGEFIDNPAFVSDAPVWEDKVGIQFTTAEFLDPALEKPPQGSELERLMNSVAKAETLNVRPKKIGMKPGSKIRVHGMYATPTAEALDLIDFAYPCVLPTASPGWSKLHPNNQVQVLEANLGAGVHYKDQGAEALYLLGLDRHSAYKKRTNPEEFLWIDKELYREIKKEYEDFLPKKRILRLD